MQVKYFEDVPDDFKPVFVNWYLDSGEVIPFNDWLKTQGFEVRDENNRPAS